MNRTNRNKSGAQVLKRQGSSKFKLFGLLLGILVLVTGILVGLSERQDADAASMGDNIDGIYTIRAENTNRLIDIFAASYNNGTNVNLWDRNGTVAQKWLITTSNGVSTIKNLGSDKVLDVAGCVAGDFQNVQQWSATNGKNQQWKFIKSGNSYKIVSALNERFVLDVCGGGTNNGANVQIYRDNGSNAQRFVLEKCDYGEQINGEFYICNAAFNKALDVYGASVESGANVHLWDKNYSAAQKWTIKTDKYGLSTVYNTHSGKALDYFAGIAACGTNIQQWTINGTNAQKWRFIKSGSGYKMLAALNDNVVVDLFAGLSASGTNIQLWNWNGTRAQIWTLDNVNKNVKYTIKYSANGGKGTLPSAQSASYNANVTLGKNALTKTGYVANGWNTKADGTGTHYNDAQVVKGLTTKNGGTVVLYAQYKDAHNHVWTPVYGEKKVQTGTKKVKKVVNSWKEQIGWKEIIIKPEQKEVAIDHSYSAECCNVRLADGSVCGHHYLEGVYDEKLGYTVHYTVNEKGEREIIKHLICFRDEHGNPDHSRGEWWIDDDDPVLHNGKTLYQQGLYSPTSTALQQSYAHAREVHGLSNTGTYTHMYNDKEIIVPYEPAVTRDEPVYKTYYDYAWVDEPVYETKRYIKGYKCSCGASK